MATKYYPNSVLFILFLVLLNIFVMGIVALTVVGIIYINWLYIIVGVVSFPILLLEDVKLLSWKLILYNDFILIPPSTFDWFIGRKSKTIKIKYTMIEEIKLIKLPAQALCLKCKDIQNPVVIYVKQFSKKQVQNLLNDLQMKVERDF